MALLTVSLADASGIVFCVGVDGHREIELEHGGRECHPPENSQDPAGISVQPGSECLDLPAIGTSAITLPSFNADQVPVPPVVFLAVSLEFTPRIETRLVAQTDARAGPANLSLHIRSTVLLV